MEGFAGIFYFLIAGKTCISKQAHHRAWETNSSMHPGRWLCWYIRDDTFLFLKFHSAKIYEPILCVRSTTSIFIEMIKFNLLITHSFHEWHCHYISLLRSLPHRKNNPLAECSDSYQLKITPLYSAIRGSKSFFKEFYNIITSISSR